MPELKPYVDDVHIFAPADEDEAESIEIPRGPEHQDAARARAAATTRSRRRIATVQPDDISTGDLAPDGVEVMSYRSNIPAIAEFTFRTATPSSASGCRSGGRASSSAARTTARAHRASTPRWRRCSSGVKAVFAKSFARIHRRNLVAQGILALTFKDDADYDRAEVGQCWTLPKVKRGARGGLRRDHRARSRTATSSRSPTTSRPKEREILVEGGLLHYLKEHGEQAAA